MSGEWYSCYLTRFETTTIKWKKIPTYCPWNTTTNVSELFKNSKKINKVWKSSDLPWCDGVTRGYCDKSWEDFTHFIVMMFTKLKHLTRSICVIVYERVSGCIFWIQAFLYDLICKKSLYQSHTARSNLKLCSCQLLYLRLFSISKVHYKQSDFTF